MPIAIFILSTVMLLLTRSRAACAGLAAALAALYLLKMSARAKIVLAVGGAWLASTLVFAWGCSGARHRSGTVGLSSSGSDRRRLLAQRRVPLWTELLGYARQRPILGYGYDSFWTARHIEDLSAVSVASLITRINAQRGRESRRVLDAPSLPGVARRRNDCRRGRMHGRRQRKQRHGAGRRLQRRQGL